MTNEEINKEIERLNKLKAENNRLSADGVRIESGMTFYALQYGYQTKYEFELREVLIEEDWEFDSHYVWRSDYSDAYTYDELWSSKSALKANLVAKHQEDYNRSLKSLEKAKDLLDKVKRIPE